MNIGNMLQAEKGKSFGSMSWVPTFQTKMLPGRWKFILLGSSNGPAKDEHHKKMLRSPASSSTHRTSSAAFPTVAASCIIYIDRERERHIINLSIFIHLFNIIIIYIYILL